VHTHGTAGPQFQGHSASYGKSYAWGFSAGSNPKPGDPAENESHVSQTKLYEEFSNRYTKYIFFNF
jgi:hypothetical protein